MRNRLPSPKKSIPKRTDRGEGALLFDRAKEPENAVVIGRIVRPIGIGGQLKVIFDSGDADKLKGRNDLIVRLCDYSYLFKLTGFQLIGGYARISLAGIETVDDAELLRNGELVVDRAELPQLGEGEYYIDALVGCRVEAEDGEELGTLSKVIEQGHHDIWVVDGKIGEIMIPARREFIDRVDITAKLIIVRRIEGLWEEA